MGLACLQHISFGALFLASKVEECPRKVRDVLNVYSHLEQKRNGVAPVPLDIYSNRYTSLKDRLIRAEREILKELGFILYTVCTGKAHGTHRLGSRHFRLLFLPRDGHRSSWSAGASA